MRKLIAVLAVAALTAALVLSAVAFGATTKRVGVRGFSFTPKTVTIHKGDTIRWHWSSAIPHQLKGKGFSTGAPKGKVTYSHKFTRAGRYPYVCQIHKAQGMKGTIIVR